VIIENNTGKLQEKAFQKKLGSLKKAFVPLGR
jgi:hypothetical protein